MLIKKDIAIFVFLLALAAIFSFSVNQILEPDQFYHFRHSALYAERGVFSSAFPWTQFSVWKTHSADIWYGFHILLIPFTLFSNELVAMKIAAALFAGIALFTLYKVFRRHEFRYPIFWTLLIYFATPNFLFRFSMLRPNTLTIALLVALFSLLIKPVGQNPKTNHWFVLGITTLLTFLHLSFFWVAALIMVVTTGVRWLIERRLEWQKMLLAGVGLVAGWLLRPNPIGALKILWAQLGELMIAKQRGVLLLSGAELQPLDLAAVAAQMIPFLVIWIATIIFFIRSRKQNIWASGLILSVIFLILGFVAGRRSADFWAIFTVLSAGYIFTSLAGRAKKSATIGLVVIFMFVSIWHSYLFFELNSQAHQAGGVTDLKSAAIWLKDNAKPGEIVFHTSWDSFSMLFFWNPRNYYINGADPIFQYSYNSGLYFKNLFIAVGGKPYTCPMLPCTPESGETLYRAIHGDFRASYVLVELSRNASLARNLAADQKFGKVFDNGEELIFAVKP